MEFGSGRSSGNNSSRARSQISARGIDAVVNDIRVSRAYDHEPTEGAVFLVDRVWPRGLSKADLQLDAWLRDVAPSNELRIWFGHRPERFAEFADRYRAELQARPDVVLPLREALRRGPVTLLYGAKDREHNQAVVLRDYLRSPELGGGRPA